jgi:hypothetical protein
MAAREILLIVLLLPVLAFGEESPKLPSNKASVVLPLLERFSPKDNSPKAILNGVRNILGPTGLGMGGGPDGHQWRTFYYFLDDGTEVSVSVCDLKGFENGIRIFIPGKPMKVVFSRIN